MRCGHEKTDGEEYTLKIQKKNNNKIDGKLLKLKKICN